MDVVLILSIASGVVTLLAFFTGRPSILHFLPIERSIANTLLPSPRTRWRFITNEGTLYLRFSSLHVAVLLNLEKLADYRIRRSRKGGRYLILYRRSFEKLFCNIVVVNSDGSCRQEHSYFSGLIDAGWIDDYSYLVFLKPDMTREFFPEVGWNYPSSWRHLSPASLGLEDWKQRGIEEGNYRVQVDAANAIICVSRY